MGYLSFIRDERLLLAGLGLASVGLVGIMHVILQLYRDEAEIKPAEPKTQYITQDTEDALKLGTLDKLLHHYNFSVRDTALKIVAGRAVNDPSAIDQLLWGITEKSYDTRMKCLRALILAVEDKETYSDPLAVLDNAKAYSALVRCLEHCLDDVEHEKLDDPLYDEYYLRDVGERRCIMLFCNLVHKYGVDRLLQSRFIDRWLVKQPWGEKDEERQKNFIEYMDRKKNRISDICSHIRMTGAGRKALYRAKLLNKQQAKERPRDRSEGRIKVILEISMANEAENDEIQPEDFQAELVPRVVDQSAEEQRRRRRHREAIVLNDGTHSLDRGDIIEREQDSTG